MRTLVVMARGWQSLLPATEFPRAAFQQWYMFLPQFQRPWNGEECRQVRRLASIEHLFILINVINLLHLIIWIKCPYICFQRKNEGSGKLIVLLEVGLSLEPILLVDISSWPNSDKNLSFLSRQLLLVHEGSPKTIRTWIIMVSDSTSPPAWEKMVLEWTCSSRSHSKAKSSN